MIPCRSGSLERRLSDVREDAEAFPDPALDAFGQDGLDDLLPQLPEEQELEGSSQPHVPAGARCMQCPKATLTPLSQQLLPQAAECAAEDGDV